MEENSGTQAPTPQTAGQADPGARRLARSRRDRMVAGVAGGLGDYFGVDPLLFRIGFVAIAIAGAPGVLIYLACWLLLPEEGGSPRGEPPRSTLLRAIGMALAVVIVLGIGGGLLSGLLVALPLPVPFLSSNFLNFLNFLNFDLWFPELFGAAALIAVGFVLLYGVNSTGARRSGTGGPSVQQVSGTAALEKGATTSGALTTQSYVTPRVRRERSPLGWLGFGAALVLVSAILLLNKAGVTSLDAGDVSGVFLAALGAVVLIGAWWGRARWLVPVGLLFVPIALLLSMIDVPMRGSIGSHYLAATDQSDLSDIAMLAGD
ncbi:MAG: PspC domain-containing protein, partial [Actinomycetota bacterium]